MMDAIRRADARLRRAMARANGGVVPFWGGRFARTDSRAAYAARLHAESEQVRRLIRTFAPDASVGVDVGCGFGRLTPAIDGCVSEYVGVEPNDGARAQAERLYPDCRFRDGTAQRLPIADGEADVTVTWTVLQHLDGNAFDRACAELQRITVAGGVLICCEKTSGDATAVLHPRHEYRYDNALEGCKLVDSEYRALEPPAQDYSHRVMVFRK